jgi:hypothetical protein
VGDSTHEQIKRLLNADQAAKLDQMRDAARKDLADRRAKDSLAGMTGGPGAKRY